MALTPLTEATQDTTLIHPRHKKLLQDFAKRLPETQRGLFFVDIENTAEYGPIINKVLLNPNDAIVGMNMLEKREPTVGLHDPNRSVVFTVKDIEMIVANGAANNQLPPTRSFADYVFPKNTDESAADYYKAQGLDYKGSYLLQAALVMPDLSFVEKTRLERISKILPKETHDAFTVDLVEDNGSLKVQSLAISPLVLKQLLHENGIEANIPHKTPKRAIEGDEYARTADALPASGRRIA